MYWWNSLGLNKICKLVLMSSKSHLFGQQQVSESKTSSTSQARQNIVKISALITNDLESSMLKLMEVESSTAYLSPHLEPKSAY